MLRFGKRLALLILIMGLWLPARYVQAQPQHQNNDKVPRFESADCPFGAPTAAVRCGYLVVREDRANPASRTIRLAIAIIKSKSADPAPDPVVFLEGGPGGSALLYAGAWFDSPFLAKRDLILMEQRGIRFSDPRMDCPEIAKALFDNFTMNLGLQEEMAREVQAATLCRDRLKNAGINLAAYNSAASAADLEDLRQALGYKQWNLFGVSYGTRLALTAMRDWPQGIRSVILDSTYPPQVQSYVDRIPNAARAFETLFTICAEDADCRAAYPNLKSTFYDLIERLDTQPMKVSMIHPFTGQPITLQITGGDLAGVFFVALYSPSSAQLVPFLIDQISRGNSNILEPLAQEVVYLLGTIEWGMFYSVECYERRPFGSPEAVEAAVQAYPKLRNFLVSRSDVAICDIWGAGQAGSIENQPVRSTIPTLILAGEFDPTTPPAWGKSTAETLTHGHYYFFSGMSHGVFFDSGCASNMALAFVDKPDTAPDSRCMAELRRPPFIRPADVYVTPALYRLNTELLGKRDFSQMAILGLCLTLFLAEIPLGLLSLIRRLVRALLHKTGPTQQPARWTAAASLLAALTVILNLVFVIGLVAVVRQVMVTNSMLLGFGIPSSAAALFVLPPLTAVLSVGLLIFAYSGWRNRWWSTVGRIRYSLVAAAAVLFTYWLLYWGLLRL